VALAAMTDEASAMTVFMAMDDNGGGIITLVEFCEYIKTAEINAGTAIGLSLNEDEEGGVGKAWEAPSGEKVKVGGTSGGKFKVVRGTAPKSTKQKVPAVVPGTSPFSMKQQREQQNKVAETKSAAKDAIEKRKRLKDAVEKRDQAFEKSQVNRDRDRSLFLSVQQRSCAVATCVFIFLLCRRLRSRNSRASRSPRGGRQRRRRGWRAQEQRRRRTTRAPTTPWPSP
jgi:hypothetical protein